MKLAFGRRFPESLEQRTPDRLRRSTAAFPSAPKAPARTSETVWFCKSTNDPERPESPRPRDPNPQGRKLADTLEQAREAREYARAGDNQPTSQPANQPEPMPGRRCLDWTRAEVPGDVPATVPNSSRGRNPSQGARSLRNRGAWHHSNQSTVPSKINSHPWWDIQARPHSISIPARTVVHVIPRISEYPRNIPRNSKEHVRVPRMDYTQGYFSGAR